MGIVPSAMQQQKKEGWHLDPSIVLTDGITPHSINSSNGKLDSRAQKVGSNNSDTTTATNESLQYSSHRPLTSDMISFTTTVLQDPSAYHSSSSADIRTLKPCDVTKSGTRRKRQRFSLFQTQQHQSEDEGEEEQKHKEERTVTMLPHSHPPVRPFGAIKIESTGDRGRERDTGAKNGYMYSLGSSMDSTDPSLSNRKDRRSSTTSRVSTGRGWSRALSVTHDRQDVTTIAALVTATPTTVWNTFLQTVGSFADKPAIAGREHVADRIRRRFHASDAASNMVDVAYSWAQHAVRVRCVARTLLQLGFRAGEGVVISAKSSPLVHAINLAVVSLGGVVAHVRSSWSACELRDHILPIAKATLVVVDSLEDNFRKALEPLEDSPEACRVPIRAVVILGDSATDCAVGNLCTNMNVIGAHDLLVVNTLATSEDDMTPSLKSLTSRVLPGQCCLLAFDYDSLGRIRGAELSHDNVIFTAAALVRSFGLVSRDRLVGYLPLYHVASQVLEFYVPLIAGLSVTCAVTYNVPLVRVITDHKPTVFFAAPATWTSFSQQVYRAKSDVNATIYSWAKTRATNNSHKLLFAKRKGSKHRSLGYMLAKALVLNKIKKKIGLESCTACYSVLSPLDFELERLFKTVDTPIYQLFGTAETSGFAALNFPHAWEFGSCGRALPGTTIRCDERSQETVLRGRNVLLGYRYSPPYSSLNPEFSDDDNSDQYQSTCDSDGWFRLWQRGFLTPTGFLKLSDPRDFLVLATGDWVPVQPFECAMMELMPELDRALLVGDGRTFLSVLFFLKTSGASVRPGAANKHTSGLLLDDGALKVGHVIGSTATTITEAIRCQRWAVHFDTVLEKLPQMCSISGVRVRKWILMATDFSVESGELDPDTGDVCRRSVDRKYQALLDSLYS